MRLLPMSDDRAETHVIVDDPASGTRQAIHFQEWWIRHRASLPAHGFPVVGIDDARPAPGVLEAIADADVVVLAPSNPVVSIGTILQVPGIRDALRSTSAPVVGLSPIINGAPVRGMADACLTGIGVATTAVAVAELYGARSRDGILDAWLVDESDADAVAEISALGIACRAVPLLMTDVPASARMAGTAIELASAAGAHA
jgi:LPPG:FO 2-phospho-L-lactate transferase